MDTTLHNGVTVYSKHLRDGLYIVEVITTVHRRDNADWFPTLELASAHDEAGVKALFDALVRTWQAKMQDEVREDIAEYAEDSNVKDWVWP